MKNELLHNLGKPMKPGRFADQMTQLTEGLELKPGIQTMFQLRKEKHFVNFILNRTEKTVTVGSSDKDTGKLERNGNTKEDADHARRIWNVLGEQGYKRSI